MQKHVASILAVALTLALGGCAGEGDSNPAPTPSPTPPAAAADSPEGLWPGSTNTTRTIVGAVLDNNTYYVLYSAQATPNVIAGFVQGNGTSNNGTFTSANAKDFNLEGLGVLDATIAGNYMTGQSLNGSVTYSVGGGMVAGPTFTSTFDPAYNTTPSLASLAGIYTGQLGISSLGGPLALATVTVLADGTFTGTDLSGCNFSGAITPRARRNIFDGSITFDPAHCALAGSSLTGIAYLDAVPSPNNRLYIAAPTSPPTDGVIFSGTR